MALRTSLSVAAAGMLFAGSVLQAVEPVRLGLSPQKFRTFHGVADQAVPEALRQAPPAMPVGEVTAMVTSTDGAVWYGTKQGLVRYDARAAARDKVQYFAGKRYLPSDEVEALVADSAAGVWVRTPEGVSHIELRPMTLARKAELFEERIRARHDRHGLVSPSSLAVAGELSSSRTRDDDNDGLWTAMYAGAEMFRYAVTKSPRALAQARKSIEAVLFLEEVAGKRGFPARSYIEKGEPMPRDGEWHWTADGRYYWKADTSSDEIVGHFFIFSVAWDLLPANDPLRSRIRETARRIIDHIISNGYYLMDLDGKPTRWGKWSLDYFKQDPPDAPLNSLELVSFLKTAHHITGDARYDREYRKVVVELGYGQVMNRLKEWRDIINYSDEELAFLPFYCLFRYEKDAGLLDKWFRPAMEQWWENIAREDNPLWTFIYLTGRPDAKVDLHGAVRTLYRSPVDLITWTTKNSHRRDVTMAGKLDRHRRPEALTLLPPDERHVMKWNENPFVVDGGNGGRSEDDGAAFLLPYWMGRYHKFLLGE